MPKATDPITQTLTPQQIDEVIESNIYQPLMTKVVVYVPKVDEMSKGGILLAVDSQLTKEHRALSHGYIVAVGPEAWQDYPGTKGLPKVGDRVSFGRFEGRGTDNDFEFRIMQDSDIDSVVMTLSEMIDRYTAAAKEADNE